ncbi:MAG TPA: O-antigen ligase family protein [Nitrolancea sp.]|nr:O-antigen ligase family protein [Nitrolancea sp.]
MASQRSARRAFLPVFPHARAVQLPLWLVLVLAAAIAVAGGYELGHMATQRGVLPLMALLIGAAGVVVMVSDVRAALWSTIGVIALLPFAVVPYRLGLTLTLLEVASIVTLGTWFVTLMLHREQRLATGAPALLIGLFLSETAFAFLIGVTNGYSMTTFHDYGKFLLAVLLVFVVWNVASDLTEARRLVNVLLLAGGAAAFLGLALYAGGASLTFKVLARLIPYGYPTSDIVRYIEDNPAKPLRLTSTSVDPNSFGGLLAVLTVLACAMAIARHRSISRWVSVPALGLCGVAALLTFSRGAWVGIAVGLAVLALLRFRWLIIPGVLLALAMAAFGLGAEFVHRFWLGITLQDPATKLRLREYQNALDIIRDHPFFGVGFGNAPSINQQTGVSSIYLSIGERVGLIGLAIFLIVVAVIGLTGVRAWRRQVETPEGEMLLGMLAALSSALTVGVFDHYFFNITFPHMAALFWITCGMILALAAPGRMRRPRASNDGVIGARQDPDLPDRERSDARHSGQRAPRSSRL